MLRYADPDNPIAWIIVLVALICLIVPGIIKLVKANRETQIAVITIWVVGFSITALMIFALGYIVLKLSK